MISTKEIHRVCQRLRGARQYLPKLTDRDLLTKAARIAHSQQRREDRKVEAVPFSLRYRERLVYALNQHLRRLTMGLKERFQKAWKEQDHPRDQQGQFAEKHRVPIEVIEFVEKGITEGKTRSEIKREFERSNLAAKYPGAKSALSPIYREKTGQGIPKPSFGQRQATGQGKVYRDPRTTVGETDAEDSEIAHSILIEAGAKLDAESESGSRYYTMPSGQKVRISNHPPNGATANWMKQHDVLNVEFGMGGEMMILDKLIKQEHKG